MCAGCKKWNKQGVQEMDTQYRMRTRAVEARGIRFSVERNGKEAGHAFLYIMQNDLHDAPFGLLEDVEVKEEWRRSGIGNQLVIAVMERARLEGCYKLIATSRHGEERKAVQDWYVRIGFVNHGIELRINF